MNNSGNMPVMGLGAEAPAADAIAALGTSDRSARVMVRMGLLNFGFRELDVLARDRVVFAELQFFRLFAGVTLFNVKIARTSG